MSRDGIELKYNRKISKILTVTLLFIFLSQQSVFFINKTSAATLEADILTCFPIGTKIAMADGSYKNIENLVIGDEVRSFDLYKKSLVTGKVTKIYRHPPNESKGYYIFTTENGNQLRVTPEHILFVNKKWLPAYKVKIGEHFRTINGEEIKVTGIQYVSEKTWTYNLEVQPFNTFFAEDILVHNAKDTVEPYQPPPIIIDNATVLCCLPAGTKILLSDKSSKNIENISVGDKILSYDIKKHEFVTSKVTRKVTKIREGIYDINNGLIKITDDHPLYVCKKNGRVGWAAINPTKSRIAYGFRNPMLLELGDKLFTSNGRWIEISSITFHLGAIKTYTFAVDSVFHDYFANNVLVSNAVAEICGSSPDNTDVIDENYTKLEIKITISPDPPIERTNLTVEAVGADIVTVQIVESEIDLVGTSLTLTKVDTYKWRCFIPSNSAGKYAYIYARDFDTNTIGSYRSREILENPNPPEKVELILDTNPSDLPLDVFKLDPQPLEILAATDGRLHGIYENGTMVYISASRTYNGYIFKYWSGAGIENTTTSSLKIIVNRDREYVAHYSEGAIKPKLSFSPKSYNFSIAKGENSSTAFQIWNSGEGILNYSLTTDKKWLEVTPSSGNSSGEKDIITITVRTSDLDTGTYIANVSIVCDNGENDTFKVTLHLSSTPSQKSIKIISPNGGESWQIGGVYEIRWVYTGDIGEKVKIELYQGDTVFKVLSANTSNVGSCLWVISTNIPPGYNYRIKITSLKNKSVYDFSDGIFSLFSLSTVHFLYLSYPTVCYEKQPFSVSVFDEMGNPIKYAKVSFYGQNVLTNESGVSSPLLAPSIDKDTQVFIIASKPGYIYATAAILVKDVEKLIKIDAPKKVKEGENFTVSVVFYNVLDPRSPSYIVLDAEVEFDNETKEVDEFGKVKFRAPKVENNIRLPITVYIDFFDTTTNTYLLIENSENMDIAGAIKKVFTQTWLILFAAILFTIFTTFILLTSKRKSRKINIIAPVHVGSNKEFIVRVKDNKDRAIPDAIVEFNGVTKKTDRRGMVKFKAPNTTEIKELYITAEKDNISESIPIMVGSISPHKELYPYMNPPSITEEEIQVFSPIDKRQLESTQAKQSQTQELPKIATASNEIINKLIDAVLEKHKRK